MPKETIPNEESSEIGFYERAASVTQRQSLRKSLSKLKSFDETSKLPPIASHSTN